MMEWDEKKNRANIKKHGISFEEAQEVFNDPNSVEYFDEQHSSAEEARYICIGDIGCLLIVTVVYQDKAGNVRIISARPAVSREKEAYYEHLRKAIGRNQKL